MIARAEELGAGSDAASGTATRAASLSVTAAGARARDESLAVGLRAPVRRWSVSVVLDGGVGKISASRESAERSRVAVCGFSSSFSRTNGRLLNPPMSPGPPPPSPGDGWTFARLSTGSSSA